MQARIPGFTAPVRYPSSDGKPIAESDLHRRLLNDVIERLIERYSSRTDVYVSGNLLVYYKAGDPRKARNDMQELKFVRELAEIDWVARRAGVDRSDWSMAREPGALAFFDGILSGIHDGRSFYLKEDLIFELLGNLANRDPAFRPYFRFANVFEEFGYPYGHRLDLGLAIQSCALLTTARTALAN